MASNNELSSSNDKSISKKHLNEHEETIKSDQMASKKSLSNDGEEQIASMDENDLKNLLDEALTYKNPRDANEKSETFKRLLQNVTEEEEHKRKFESNSLHWKAQSNSLQNLLDESHYQLQNHQSQISSKKHQQRRKNSTSVSTRRLEGGSLPVDMHHSSAIQSPPDQPFLSELKNSKKRKEKQHAKDTVIDMLDIETDDRKSFQRCFDSNKDTTLYHDAIELKPFANRIEMEVQDQPASKFTTAYSTPNTITTMATTTSGGSIPTIMSSKMSTKTSSVDSTIQFQLEQTKSYQQAHQIESYYTSVNHNNNIVLTGGSSSSNYSSSGGKIIDQALPLTAGIAVNSVIDPKFSFPKQKTGQSRDDASSSMQTAPSILSTNHSSTTTTTTINSKDNKASKKRTAKSERNEKKINVETIEGYRGYDTVEKLLTYIDGQHNSNSNADGKGQKNHPKNGIVSSNNSSNSNNNNNSSNNDKQANEQLLNADDKKKQKLVSKNKEKMNKLKKSNSMDELCSTGRQQEKEKSVAAINESSTANKIVQDVTLRSKNNTNNNSNVTSGAKKSDNKGEKSQAKRNERRSWGTEGLWPQDATTSDINTASITKSADQNNDDNQENESSSSSSSGVQILDFATSDPVHNINNNNVNNNNNSNINNNFESTNTSSEADKFQVVIKKKKVKRKSSENPDTKSSTTSSTTGASSNNNFQTYVIRRDVNLRGAGTKSNNANNNNNSSNESSRNENKNAANNNNNNNNNAKYDKNSKQTSQQDAKQNSIGKNRRKSTSSMPRSDDEYSDGGDSVQSLPIETTKTTSSLLSAPNNNNNNSSNNNTTSANTRYDNHHSSAENSGKMMIKNNNTNNNNKINNNNASVSNPTQQMITPLQQISLQQSQQQKPTTFSYADIAKTNTSRTNANNSNNNVVPASTEKMWPSISSSSSSTTTTTNTHQINNIINNNNNNNSNNDPFAISNFDAMSNTNNNNNNIIATNPPAKQQHKSTPSLNNTMSFPDLVAENTNNNNSKNKQVNNNSQMEITTNGDATQTEKSLNGLERVFDNNNNPSTTATNDRLSNNSNAKISYSQSLLEHHQEMDANGNNSNVIGITKADTVNASTTTASIKNTLIKSKSVDHNNLSSIEHYPALEKTKQTLSDVLSKPIESLSNKTTKTKQQQLQQHTQQQQQSQLQQTKVGATVEMTIFKDENGNGGKKKKDKLALKKSTSTVSTSTAPNQQYSTQFSSNSINSITNSHNHTRPAVIIMNDCEKSNDDELGITFGFEINEHLLFGHQNGDAVLSADIDRSVEMNINNNVKNKNNSNCDIMNTNNLSNNNNMINNLTNQSCGFEIYENFISSPPQSVIDHHHSQQMIQHQVPIIQSSPKLMSNNISLVKDNTTLLDSSNDLGYMSSSLITNSTTSPANQKLILSNEIQQPLNSDQYENDSSVAYHNAVDIKQRVKLDELISRFVSPEPAKNFNYDELVTFVSEEWTKVERNGVIFNGQQ